MLYIICRFIWFVLFKIFVGLKGYGRDNIPKSGGFILASNHASNMDPVAIGVASARPINFMAKEELFSNKFFGFILGRVNVFPVKRGKADLSSIKEAIKRLKRGEGLLLFPQGTRRDTIELEDAKGGVGFFASKAGVPIVPTLIKGSDVSLPKGSKLPKRTGVNICFGQPIYTKPNQDYNQIAQSVISAIKQLEQAQNKSKTK
ncbi:MAG TPA: 1-acyl-sn-glycerol-3-phosphate acyltransferase [Candidatus Omnitrophica bacterium]|nr:1-acyl-sn-glycerol-3-phosphate acyltransferase [Candidatus Omnitrophota bacterium]